MHTIDPSCIKNERQLRDKPLRPVPATWNKVAAAARNPSADQQDSHQLQPPHSLSMQ
ncbi:hypothetical protein SynPROSU1_01301 [Synechococcus sp. PROS-U-1]|nr:hypothetical protein SynPROSU1_01301 [Synechococcus sp. PROS-U-1]